MAYRPLRRRSERDLRRIDWRLLQPAVFGGVSARDWRFTIYKGGWSAKSSQPSAKAGQDTSSPGQSPAKIGCGQRGLSLRLCDGAADATEPGENRRAGGVLPLGALLRRFLSRQMIAESRAMSWPDAKNRSYPASAASRSRG